jgi:hypothetical protein
MASSSVASERYSVCAGSASAATGMSHKGRRSHAVMSLKPHAHKVSHDSFGPKRCVRSTFALELRCAQCELHHGTHRALAVDWTMYALTRVLRDEST